MNFEEKRSLIISAINKSRDFAEEGFPIPLSIDLYGLSKIPVQEIAHILNKLEKEDKVIKVFELPYSLLQANKKLARMMESDLYKRSFKIYKCKNFDDWFKKQPSMEIKEFNDSSIIYEISYREDVGVVINEFFQLSNPDFNNENRAVIEYLIKHPNKMVTIKEIQNNEDILIGKPIYKILENLGFTNDLRKIFFKKAKGFIFFRNPVYKKDLDDLGIDVIRLHK